MQRSESFHGKGPQLITVKRLAALLSINERSCWRFVRQAELGRGTFPRPIRIAAKTVRWRLADVEAFLAELEGKNAARN